MKTVIRNIISIKMRKHFAFSPRFLCMPFAVLKYVGLTNCDGAGTIVVEVQW